jgi:hypothetical protein
VAGLKPAEYWIMIALQFATESLAWKTARAPAADLRPLLALRQTTTFSTSMLDPPTGRTFHMFECKCGDRSWVSERTPSLTRNGPKRLGD